MKHRHIAAVAVLVAIATGVTGTVFPASVRFQGYSFQASVHRSGGRPYREHSEWGRPTLKVRPGEEYSIVIRNPLPVRAAVALSIDGLNSIDGKRTTLRNARKWIVEPYSSVTISGWQTGMSTLRKFVFTDQRDAYAQWKENREGKNYTRNLGVIGVAWFWDARELDAVLNPPQPFAEDEQVRLSESLRNKRDASSPSAGARAESKAGTGMGSQEQHHVTEVEFDANTGMFSVRDVLKIHYEFARDIPRPQPFIDDGNVTRNFAEDMYR